MDENQKYYTPEISDIKIGYECEIKDVTFDLNSIIPNNTIIKKQKDRTHYWIKGTIKEWSDKESTNLLFTSGFYSIMISNNSIRTPYLTKEQIEAEGWKLPGIVKENTIIAYLKKEDIIYIMNYEKSILRITKLLRKENTNLLDEQLYKGTCPSINEFKTICKLLNIK